MEKAIENIIENLKKSPEADSYGERLNRVARYICNKSYGDKKGLNRYDMAAAIAVAKTYIN